MNVATCVSCHGVHGIGPPDDPTSPVYRAERRGHLREMSCRCRAHARLRHPDRPVRKIQDQRSCQSLSMRSTIFRRPTCNDCHGNHGAVPPGLDNVANVCGQCHGRQAELFRQGPHKQPFDCGKSSVNAYAVTATTQYCRQPMQWQALARAPRVPHATKTTKVLKPPNVSAAVSRICRPAFTAQPTYLNVQSGPEWRSVNLSSSSKTRPTV